MAYDSKSDRVILFGGWTGTEQSTETRSYDYNQNAWANLGPSTTPPAAVFAAMAYDEESDREILYGGLAKREGATSSETWAYDFSSNQWMKRSPGAAPAARGSHGMAYDPASDSVLLFGGRDAEDFGDTWTYDYNRDAWTQRHPPTSPPPRHGLALAADPSSGLAVLVGGVTAEGDIAGGDETWVYNPRSDSWTVMDKGPGPSNRFGAAMAYVSRSDRIVLFGGSNGGNETWSLGFATPSPPFPSILVATGVAIVGIAALGTGLWISRARGRRRTAPQ